MPYNIQEDDISFENKLYRIKHKDLCAIPRAAPNLGEEARARFDLLTFDDIMRHFQESGKLENFYASETIQPTQTIAHTDCPHRMTYLAYIGTMNGKLSKSAFAALKEFSEQVSSEFDATHNIQSFFYRRRVNAKYNALQNLLAFIESLPIAERDDLYAMKINSSNTFKSRLDRVLADDCVSQFADDITKLLYQCDNTIRFTNPRPNQVIARDKNSLVLTGEVLNTDEDDLKFLRNLQKVIINTHYEVKIGTRVTLDGKTNWVPGSVANIFHKCDDGIAGRVTPGEARYQAVKNSL
ncbi:hypothetical protein [Legionella tunisiensis]|uniref:hypothetical protein n=1 Tax=Legionella tunisiensis TaxID=1034944 RepID=UPI00037E3D71|nr:hypothetical protein [Legionella tunisiensis]